MLITLINKSDYNHEYILNYIGEKDSKIYGFLNYNDLLKKCENLWL